MNDISVIINQNIINNVSDAIYFIQLSSTPWVNISQQYELKEKHYAHITKADNDINLSRHFFYI